MYFGIQSVWILEQQCGTSTIYYTAAEASFNENINISVAKYMKIYTK